MDEGRMICDRCEKPIGVTSDDPACVTSLGTHHYECMRAAWRESQEKESKEREESRERRSKAMKERWASGAMSDTTTSQVEMKDEA